MSRRNGKPKKIHRNRLVPSTADNVFLCQAVIDRLRELRQLYERETGNKLTEPRDARDDFTRLRGLAGRYRSGDRRHTEAEWRSLKSIAQWTVNLKAALCRQPAPQIEWSD